MEDYHSLAWVVEIKPEAISVQKTWRGSSGSELRPLNEVMMGELCKAPALVGGKEDVVNLESGIKILICAAAAVGDATTHFQNGS